MKLNRLIAIAAILTVLGGVKAFAEPLQWQVPYLGMINLNMDTTEALMGYDAALKQAVGGASLPVWSDPKGFVTFQAGAVAPWPVGNQATIQPYLALGHDILREIPTLSEFKSAHANVFGRYVAGQGKAGVGVSFSYSFAGGHLPTAP